MADTSDDPSVVLTQLYKAVHAKNPAATSDDIEGAIGDIRILTSLIGASTLEVDVIDPQWLLLTSGFLDRGGDGKLDKVDLNYPEGSDYWWRLTQIDATTDKTQANVTLTFETRVVSLCRDLKGAKSWSRSQFTRAQAIKAMTVDELRAKNISPRPVFVSPELTTPQAIQVAN